MHLKSSIYLYANLEGGCIVNKICGGLPPPPPPNLIPLSMMYIAQNVATFICSLVHLVRGTNIQKLESSKYIFLVFSQSPELFLLRYSH